MLANPKLVLEISALSAGLVLLHYRLKQDRKSKLLLTAGYLMIITGMVSALTTGFFWIRGVSHGSFNEAVSKSNMMNHGRIMPNIEKCMGEMKGKIVDERVTDEFHTCLLQTIHNIPPAKTEENEDEGPLE